jgi:hypothetical protein
VGKRGPQLLRRIDLKGRRINRLRVLGPVVDRFGSLEANPRWLCLCDCGRRVKVLGTRLRSGDAKACKRCVLLAMPYRLAGYSDWCRIKVSERCCARWKKSFDAFRADMGPPRGRVLTLLDPEGPYSPQNCRWARRVPRNLVLLTYRGRTRTISQWARRWGISRQAVADHRYRGGEFKVMAARYERRGGRGAGRAGSRR